MQNHNGAPYPIAQLRNWYRQAIDDKGAARRFWGLMEGYQGSDALNLAYKGVARALFARHSWNPMDKYLFLKEAVGYFEKAVKKQPDNIEIRFLRFSIEHYTPDFVGVSTNLKADKDVFLSNLHRFPEFELTKDEVKLMASFFEESKRCSAPEIEMIRQILNP